MLEIDALSEALVQEYHMNVLQNKLITINKYSNIGIYGPKNVKYIN